MLLGPEKIQITHINDSRDHVVGLIPTRKMVVGIYVSSTKDVRGCSFSINSAKAKFMQECATKYYSTYRINEISPYESNWTYVEVNPDSIIFDGEPPFSPIPRSSAEQKNLLAEAMTIGSVWSNKKDTWVVRDLSIEKLMGKERLRVWITTGNGKRGQAVYADSLMNNYMLVASKH